MKSAIFFVFTFISFSLAIKAQEIDDNTMVINQYFQQITSSQNTPALQTQSPQESYIEISQIGTSNRVISINGNDDIEKIQQSGNLNDYGNYRFKNNQQTNIQVNQQGNLNSLLIFGENSLMDKLIINQKSNFQSIVINNFSR